MACYLDWLAPQYGSIRQSWSSKIAQLRAKATAAGRHARTPGIVAELKLAFLLFLKFCEEAGAITTAERESLNVRCWEALCEAAGRQAAHQSDTEPAQHFLRLIVAALASGQAHLADLDGRQPDNPQVFGWRERTIPTSAGPFREWQPQGKRIGWADGNGIYLEPDASYAEAQRLSESQGESIAVSSSTLRKRLDEKGFVIREGRRDEIRSRVTCEGKRRRVLHLKPDALQPVEHEGDGAAGREPDQNDAIGRVSRAGFESNPPKEFPAFPLENDELVGLGGSAAGTREVFAPANTTHRERDQREPAEL